ncbi:hypothetical protein ACFFH6_05695, partial [Halomonas organivorans]|uniref:hypothetical protein n=1 Tax=Halomonas organivorans TaxID=257772 RepID=UPI0035F30B1F
CFRRLTEARSCFEGLLKLEARSSKLEARSSKLEAAFEGLSKLEAAFEGLPKLEAASKAY